MLFDEYNLHTMIKLFKLTKKCKKFVYNSRMSFDTFIGKPQTIFVVKRVLYSKPELTKNVNYQGLGNQREKN